MKKTIQLTEGTALRIEPVMIAGDQYVSVRKMYRKKNSKEWLPSRSGITIPVGEAKKVAKYIKAMADADESDFKVIGEKE